MKKGIVIVKDAFKKEFCDAIANAPVFFQDATVGTGEKVDKNDDIRRSQVSSFSGYFQQPEIYQAVYSLIDNVNLEHFKFDLFDLENLQLTKYDHVDQGFYRHHEDTDEPNELGVQRKLSLTIQLTDPSKYQGGSLVFPDLADHDPAKTLEQGTAIVFPSYLLHGVEPVTSGVRYSLVGWARGPQFR